MKIAIFHCKTNKFILLKIIISRFQLVKTASPPALKIYGMGRGQKARQLTTEAGNYEIFHMVGDETETCIINAN